MRRSAAVLLISMLAVAGACSSDDGGGSAANTSIPDPTTTASTTTEPATVAPDIIPSDDSQIDEAYVEGVLTVLAETALQALEATRSAGVADEVAIDILMATRTEQAAADGLNSLARLAREGFEGYRSDLSPTKYTVREVLVGTSACIVAHVDVNSSGYFENASEREPPPGKTVVVLEPANAEQRASGRNPSAWVIDDVPVISENDPTPECDGDS